MNIYVYINLSEPLTTHTTWLCGYRIQERAYLAIQVTWVIGIVLVESVERLLFLGDFTRWRRTNEFIVVFREFIVVFRCLYLLHILIVLYVNIVTLFFLSKARFTTILVGVGAPLHLHVLFIDIPEHYVLIWLDCFCKNWAGIYDIIVISLCLQL